MQSFAKASAKRAEPLILAAVPAVPADSDQGVFVVTTPRDKAP
jgi:hypothetical protein